MSRTHVRSGLAWSAAGPALWYALHHAGIHATISGVVLGLAIPALFVGKQLGIFAFSLAAVRLGIGALPRDTTLPKLYGASVVAGIGFTVALFIATLAFPETPALLDEAKVGILAGSLAAGVVGAVVLSLTRRVEPAARADGPEA